MDVGSVFTLVCVSGLVHSDLQSGHPLAVFRAVFFSELLDVRRVSPQRSVCAVSSLRGLTRTLGGQHPQNVRFTSRTTQD